MVNFVTVFLLVSFCLIFACGLTFWKSIVINNPNRKNNHNCHHRNNHNFNHNNDESFSF